MSKLRASYNKLNVPIPLSFKRAVAAGVLVLAGCSSVETGGATRDTLPVGPKPTETSSSALATTRPQLDPTTITPTNPQLDPSNAPYPTKPRFKFDHLAGSTIVKVYPEVFRGEPEISHNGTYNSGEIETVECETKGRWIDPAEDHSKKSNIWYRLEGTQQYATEAYGDLLQTNPPTQLPACK